MTREEFRRALALEMMAAYRDPRKGSTNWVEQWELGPGEVALRVLEYNVWGEGAHDDETGPTLWLPREGARDGEAPGARVGGAYRSVPDGDVDRRVPDAVGDESGS